MNLRKWYSNNEELRKSFENKNEVIVKVLGVKWCTIADELSIDLDSIIKYQNSGHVTKRLVLQIVSRIFDPLGLLGPFVTRAKILIQEIWKLKISWDALLPNHLVKEWITWCSEVKMLNNFCLPRSVVNNNQSDLELHVFADASIHAFGTVAYVRHRTKENIHCKLLMAKNRVAPLNEKTSLTLPKLELTAALCAARLQDYILSNIKLKFRKVYLWSDSKISLYWIRGSTRKWKPYVANRVAEIQKLTKGEWRYCPGRDNPADLLTRGIKAKVLLESNLWKYGPDWLNGSSDWPCDEFYKCSEVITSMLGVIKEDVDVKLEEFLFPLNKFSNYNKILRITAYIFRFINNSRINSIKRKDTLTTDEINKAEIYWIKFTQKQAFYQEIKILLKKQPLNSKSNILTFNPFLDSNEIIRLGGRLQESTLPYEICHPIILPKRSTLTEHIVWASHQNVCHSGVNATLNDVRKRFWIIKGRQCIKSIIGKCLICKRFKGKCGNEPYAPLPKDRITVARPFSITGIDFTGPLYIKNKEKPKVYIMLFTCAVVRAVHLELVPDISTASCLRAFRRFISRRGVPDTIYSDNAKTFKRTAYELNELSKILQSDDLQQIACRQRIKWKFIVERASWWGGWWERLVQTVKNALKFTIRKASVNYDELQTVLSEVEAVVNSRPLTYLNDNPNDLVSLSPSHFLIGSKDIGLSANFQNPEVNRFDLLKQWKKRDYLMRKFWNRWITDYLQQLRSAHFTKQTRSTNFKIGDVALLYDQKLPRLLWKLVRIVEVFPGRDGRIRACEIKTQEGSKLRRPVQLLFPLEVDFPARENVKNLIESSREDLD